VLITATREVEIGDQEDCHLRPTWTKSVVVVQLCNPSHMGGVGLQFEVGPGPKTVRLYLKNKAKRTWGGSRMLEYLSSLKPLSSNLGIAINK
jgi:hypothetical protein